MTPGQLIDKRIAELSDWRGELFTQLRKIVLKADPQMQEDWKWDSAVWSHNGLVCSVGAFKEIVRFHFFLGALLPDPHKLLNAGFEAKKTRSIDFRENSPVKEDELIELIKAAVSKNLG